MKKTIPILAFFLLFTACSDFEESLSVPEIGSDAKLRIESGDDIRLVPPENHFTVTTSAATFVLFFGATSGGHISVSGGGKAVTERGICYSLSPDPTTADNRIAAGSGAGDFTCLLTGLEPGTLYYVRAYGIKSSVTTYGNEETFTTASPSYGTVTDIDGNTYTTITIGTQEWMMENLRTTTYRDGTPIPHITNNDEWAALTTGGYSTYNNDESFSASYGRLYNWFAVNDLHNLAPAGWHVASLAEWTVLENYLGGNSIGGRKLKETGEIHWGTGNVADNSSGFTAFGGGGRRTNGTFGLMGIRGDYWTSTEWPPNSGSANAYYREMNLGEGIGLYSNGEDKQDKNRGYSVRCVKD